MRKTNAVLILALTAASLIGSLLVSPTRQPVEAATTAVPTPPRIRRANLPAPTQSPVVKKTARRTGNVKIDGAEGEARRKRPQRRRN